MVDIEPVRLDEGAIDALRGQQTGVPNEAIVVRPNEDNSGIDGMQKVLRSLPGGETESVGRLGRKQRDTAPPFAFEMRYAQPRAGRDRIVSLQYVARDEHLDARLERHLQDKYPGSLIERQPPTLLDPDPGQYLAAATLGTRRYCLYPIANPELDDFDRDPTGSVLRELAGAGGRTDMDADVVAQVLARPIGTDWRDGVRNGGGIGPDYGKELAADERRVKRPLSIQELRHILTEPVYERRARIPTVIGEVAKHFHPVLRDDLEHDPSEADKQAEKMLSDLDGRGWGIQVRLVAVSDDPDLARRRVTLTGEMFDNFYEYRSRQTFVPIPQNGDDAISTATAAAARTWPDEPEQRVVKSQIEAASLTNIPKEEDVHTQLQWNLSAPGDGIPPGTPQFESDLPASATREERQRAMLDAAGPDQPLWYGTGVRHGTEAGVYQDTLIHQFVGGTTGMGKTTLLSNYAAQVFRGGGGLIIDPKGVDMEDFLAEWPEDDAEDLVVMDLSDRHDRVPKINFMEIPDYLEPGSRAHTGYCEALAEDILAMVAEAGGSDKYMGALMKRVVKAVVRGLAKSGKVATLLDVATVCASAENISRFRQRMEDERFHYLRQTAERLEQRSDTDLEPLAGRMDEWVLNANVRELICTRDSSFSVNELVRDGKWLVVRFDAAASEAEKTMIGTALIRRAYFAQRHLEPDHTFDLICDEFDEIASEQSNIHKILSEARAFDFRATLACQAPTNQLPEQVLHAIENQCGTFLSFNPGGGKDAGWIGQQHTVDKESLLNLPRYRFYMRSTTKENELTHSYQVEGFPPAREALEDTRTEDDIRRLVEDSLDRYGAPKAQGEESLSAFAAPDPEEEGGKLDVANDEQQERAAVQAVYDTTLREDAEYVTVNATLPALHRRLEPFDGDAGDAWRDVYQHVRDDWLDVRGSETTELKAMNPRSVIATVGADQSAGGAGHAMLMWDAYRPLTRAGLDMTISEAQGTDPDATARPVPDDKQSAPDVVSELTDGDTARIEAEHSTGRTKPGATVRHVLQAQGEDRQTIVLCRPENEQTVRDTLFGDPICARRRKNGHIRYYTSPRDLTVDGEPMERPGASENVWVRENAGGGDIVLRDRDGTEHARFESVDAVFNDADAYPDGGDTTIKSPVIPDFDGLPDATVAVVPEGAETLADLSIGAEPDVPDRAEDLYDLLREYVAPQETITRQDAMTIAHTNGLDVSQPTVYRWMNDLQEAGVIIPGEKTEDNATQFSVLYA